VRIVWEARFFQYAKEVDGLCQDSEAVHGVYGIDFPEGLKKQAVVLRSNLALTRGEAMLCRLFCADQLAAQTAEARDDSVRKVKAALVQHGKWSGIFAPLLKRAKEAMALR